MIKNVLVLADGTEISSGASGAAIRSLRLTGSVNDGQSLNLGSACASMLEATLLDVAPGKICAGEELVLYTEDEGGRRQKMGIFIAQKPERTGSHTLKLTAYDRMILLDRDLTGWLAELTGWPYSLQDFARLVCDACAVALVEKPLPNGEFPVAQFSGEGITGRQLIRWIAQASGRFFRMDAEGRGQFDWYAPASVEVGPAQIFMAQADYEDKALNLQAQDAVVTDDVSVASAYLTITDDGEGNATLVFSDALKRQFCYQGGLSLAEYATSPMEKVQIRSDEEDVGTVVPADAPDANTYRITGNPLLAAVSSETLQSVAQTLYTQLKDISYTPGSLKLPAGQPIAPGSILQVYDANGNEFCFYVMTLERRGNQDILTCAGTRGRDDTDAFNSREYAPLSGKVLRLRTDVDGIRAENADAAGRLSRLELDLAGIRTQVQTQQTQGESIQTQMTALEQTAQSITARVTDMEEHGVSKLTNEFGLTIDGSAVRIHRSGNPMENQLNEQGMSVVRDAGTANETVMLKADDKGVIATDVTVRNYLRVGHSRLEDYNDGTNTKRTACFYIGE